MNAKRTPAFSPNQTIITPPNTGPRAIGIRRTSECIETPIVRLFFGRTRATMSIVAGREMAVHERKKTAPMITAGQ